MQCGATESIKKQALLTIMQVRYNINLIQKTGVQHINSPQDPCRKLLEGKLHIPISDIKARENNGNEKESNNRPGNCKTLL